MRHVALVFYTPHSQSIEDISSKCMTSGETEIVHVHHSEGDHTMPAVYRGGGLWCGIYVHQTGSNLITKDCPLASRKRATMVATTW